MPDYAPNFPHGIFAYENAITDAILARTKSYGLPFRIYRTNWPSHFEEYIVMNGTEIIYNHTTSSAIWAWIDSYYENQKRKQRIV